MLKEDIAGLHEQINKFRNVDDTGEDFTGADFFNKIKNIVDSMDTLSTKLDVLDPVVEVIAEKITVVDMTKISDQLDSADVELLYKNIISKPAMILSNGIFNYIMKKKDRFAMLFTDDILDIDKENIDNISKIINLDRDTIVILYFLEKIIRYILIDKELFSDLDTEVNIATFKRFRELNIVAETNVYYSAIVAENYLKIDCALDEIKDQVMSYIKTYLDPDNLIDGNDILKNLL